MKSAIRTVEKRLRYRFKQKALLQHALTHPSFCHEAENLGEEDNQRLEFLGDAVLGMISADWLFANQPDLREGAMTKFRAALTNKFMLAEIGAEWEIGAFLRMGRGETNSGGATRESNLADLVEAIVGAVYMDGGWKAANKFFKQHFEPKLRQLIETGREENNPKGELQEYTQREWKCGPRYQIIDTHGPAHDRSYTAEVRIRDKVIATGDGRSKQTAEVAAAQAALDLLRT